MSIWQARPVGDAPEIALRAWRVMETDIGERHFVGVRPDRGTGRVSSAIVEFDARTRVGVTRSGRRYILEGPQGPDANGDSEYVWAAWCQVNRVASFRDVTNEVLHRELP
ncbi:hypothetical protein DOT79_19170 [Ralstonia pseudosolanacearum]|nr:hypothetical protein DOT79_19170 [Ralstonia pseudosolanacearum]